MIKTLALMLISAVLLAEEKFELSYYLPETSPLIFEKRVESHWLKFNGSLNLSGKFTISYDASRNYQDRAEFYFFPDKPSIKLLPLILDKHLNVQAEKI